jgi:hypothetical protein
MRSFWKILAAGTAGAMLSAMWIVWSNATAASRTRSSALTSASAGLTIERVRSLSALTTLRVEVADALVTELRGATGSVKAILIVRGRASIGVDLSEARFEAVNTENRTARLVLCQPRLQSAAVDLERTKLIGVVAVGLWTIVPGGGDADTKAINRAYRDAQRALSAAAADAKWMERTRELTEELLREFVRSLGWSLEIEWTDRCPAGLSPAGDSAVGCAPYL